VETKIKIGLAILVLLIISNLFTGAAYKSEKVKRISAETKFHSTQQQLSKTAKALTEAEASSSTFSNQEVVRNKDGSVFLDGEGKAIILTRQGSSTASRSSSTLSEAIASASSSIENITKFNKDESEIITIAGVKKWSVIVGFKPFKLETSVGATFRQKVFMFEMGAGLLMPVYPIVDYKETMALLQVAF